MTNRRSKITPIRLAIATAVTLLVLLLATGVAGIRQPQRPRPYSGGWLIVGLDGGERGKITFNRDGGIDTDDEFTGTWSVENGTVQVTFWNGEPDSWFRKIFPQRDLFEFVPTLDDQRDPIQLRGEYVLLVRQGSEER